MWGEFKSLNDPGKKKKNQNGNWEWQRGQKQSAIFEINIISRMENLRKEA